MTLVRRKALEISSWVTWLAAPGCREWAEGLEREVEFISSDWAALRWAIGSTRVLLDRREAPIRSLSEVPAAAKEYFDSFRRKLPVFLARFWWVFWAAFMWFCIVHWTEFSPMVKLGFLLGIGYLPYEGYRARVYLRRNMVQPCDAYEWALRYRSELQKDVEFVGGRAGRISEAVGLSSYCLYFGSLIGPMHGIFALFMALNIVLGTAFQVKAIHVYRRKLQYRIANLDVLLAEKHGVSSL